MENAILITLAVAIISGLKPPAIDIPKYHDMINKAELLICEGNFHKAGNTYKLAFKNIEKPFGKDVFNAALASQLSNQNLERDKYLQTIINNSDDLEFVKSMFVNKYMSEEDWQSLIEKQKINYDPNLRKEFKEILDRDQLFRPMYETHDDTINANEKINIARILSISESTGFPSQIELGYTNRLRGQNLDIVLHHIAQRRSYDKSVIDLEPKLFKAVNEGRFDPEAAIFYMNFQNDIEKGEFEDYSTWQFKHSLLPDSLNNKVWLPKLNEEQKRMANEKRKKWFANSLEEIAIKAMFLSDNDLPFIFTCVRKSIAYLHEDFNKETAFEQYKAITKRYEEYKR